MTKFSRVLIIIVGIVACLLEIGYMVPALAKYVGGGLPALPVMPTFAFPGASSNATSAPTNASKLITATPLNGTQIATNTPTSTSTATPQPTVVGTAQQCNNILYPIRVGQKWLYQVSGRGLSYQVSMTVPSATSSQTLVDLSNTTTGVVSHASILCNNGIIRTFPWMTAGVLFGNALNGAVNVQYDSGVLLPDSSDFINHNWGLAWSGAYHISGSGHITFRGNNYNLTLSNSPASMVCQTLATGNAAFESISVYAGTYPKALKVVCRATSQATGTVNGNSVIATLNGQTTLWFAQNVGLLKMQVDSTQVTIFGLTLPVNVSDAKIELNQFIPAP